MFNQTGCSMGGAMLCLLLKPIQFIVFFIVFYIFQLNFYKTNVKMVVKDVILTEDYTKQACSLLSGEYVALQCVLPLSKKLKFCWSNVGLWHIAIWIISWLVVRASFISILYMLLLNWYWLSPVSVFVISGEEREIHSEDHSFSFQTTLVHNQFLFSSVLTGRAEHQTTVFHIPLAHLVVISGVPPARRHPDLGHPVFWPGQIPLPHPGLLRHAHVSFTDCAPCCLTALVPLAPPVYHGFCCLPLFTVSSEITYWQETSQWIWDYCR